jgi:hypothetical protein
MQFRGTAEEAKNHGETGTSFHEMMNSPCGPRVYRVCL